MRLESPALEATSLPTDIVGRAVGGEGGVGWTASGQHCPVAGGRRKGFHRGSRDRQGRGGGMVASLMVVEG